MEHSFSFLQITDHHLGPSDASVRYGYAVNYTFRQTLRHMSEHAVSAADFLISTGDLVDPPTSEGYQRLCHSLGVAARPAFFPGPLSMDLPGRKNFPLYLMPGNHDDRNLLCQQIFPQTTPGALLNGSFEHKGVLFLCLDWGSHAQAWFYPELEQFLAHNLRRGLPTVIFTHHQVTPLNMRWMDAFLAAELEAFWRILKTASPGQVLGIIAGHTHLTYDTVVDGIPVWGLRATSYTFNRSDQTEARLDNPQYRLFTIHNGVLTTQLYEVELPMIDEASA